MKIVWSPTAIADLQSIRNYIAEENPISARTVAQQIKEAIRRLGQYPLSGRSGRVPGTRELVIPGTPYLAAYAIEQERICIAAILHGKQRWPESF
jgi:toxin ParE1/3/4